MGILDEDIQRVREATDIVAVIGEHVQLKRVGRRWQGLCPFHGEKSPSFSVNAEEGLYYCFGCQAKGDAITFVREIERLDFVGAVERLAGRAGITLRYTDANEQQNRRKRAELYDAVEAAVAWYHDRLLSGSDAGEARAATCGRAASTATTCARTGSGGRPTPGTPSPRRSSCPTRSSWMRGSAS
ncbi:MAG: CHC2 zinc finger domain-containing protein [Acidimicrobiales bacterium]